MTRVATFAQSQFLFNELQRIRQQTFETQTQIATGKKAQTFQGLGGDAGVLVSARALDQQTEQFKNQIASVESRLKIQDIHLTTVHEAAEELHQAVLDAIAVDNADGLMVKVENIYERVSALLNTKYDGEYIYSGSLTDVPSVNGSQLSDLVAAATASDVFQNNALQKQVRVDTNIMIEIGVLADDVAGELFGRLKAIADFDAGGGGPLSGKLTQAQQNFLTGELAALSQAAENAVANTARNGRQIEQAEGALVRHEATDVYVKGLISDIEDVDIAEAITRLNQDQLATEAALNTIAQLSNLTLLNYLR